MHAIAISFSTTTMANPKVGTLRHSLCEVLCRSRSICVSLSFLTLLLVLFPFRFLRSFTEPLATNAFHGDRLSDIRRRCQQLHSDPGPPLDFHKRSRSERFVPGTKPVLLMGAKIWTGRNNGTEVVHGDVLLDKGIIQSVGSLGNEGLEAYGSDLVVIDTKGSWLTPGIVDVHSHIGVFSSPELDGTADGNSFHATIQPWLRSIDALNTHDQSFPLSIAGGVTTSLVPPGSANAMGGQAFVIKLRETMDRSPSSMLLEPPYQLNRSSPNPSLPFRWRHIKHACGENPSRVFGDTRMDTVWAFREAYNTAREIKRRQDDYCAAVKTNNWKRLGEFPEDLQWESLVDVLRGRVKVNIHCYEAVDIDAMVHLSNEFEFSIAAFHHASESYLVTDLINKAYGKPPAVALFATFSRYKREAYRSSEFAPRILAESGITVTMKSDHPAIHSRYLIHEAQQAYFYGLPDNLALASVTANAAAVLGMDHRIGYVKKGWDADIVLWDSHPLALGATPTQVFVDGIPQLESPHVVRKPKTFQETPKVPNFDEEAKEAVEYEGLPPLTPKKASSDTVIFINVKSVFRKMSNEVQNLFYAQDESDLGVVVTHNGSIICSGTSTTCLSPHFLGESDSTTIDLESGSISPGFVTSGSTLGLQHIAQEPSTGDGPVLDPLNTKIPEILGDNAIIRAVDGLEFGSRDALIAYRAGVTSAIIAPSHAGFYSGLGTFFSLGTAHKLDHGAVIQEVTAVHVTVGHSLGPSVSTQIAALRRLLLGKQSGAAGQWFKKVAEGRIPLVVEAGNADVIATLTILKKTVESKTGNSIKLTVTHATEAHLLAKELGEAGVGIILTPSRIPFPSISWDDRRILPGPPITMDSAIFKLLSHNVTVGIGSTTNWSARNLPFDIAWAAIEAGGRISKEQAFAMGSCNVENLLGSTIQTEELVATVGGDLLEWGSRTVAVISPSRKVVDLFT